MTETEPLLRSAVAQAISDIPDPEVPVVTIEDLRILRHLEVDEAARRVSVTITPTYSGCPAMEAIEHRVVHEAQRHGYACLVETRLSPAWTTDWMSERGRQRLREFGIAPPDHQASAGDRGPVGVSLRVRQVACPQCGSTDTEELARFGSTACKALRRCRACREPFDEFKAI
jgi:ring-1,2-phenylacetyl-CoA epoxidase subunit PaaD